MSEDKDTMDITAKADFTKATGCKPDILGVDFGHNDGGFFCFDKSDRPVISSLSRDLSTLVEMTMGHWFKPFINLLDGIGVAEGVIG